MEIKSLSHSARLVEVPRKSKLDQRLANVLGSTETILSLQSRAFAYQVSFQRTAGRLLIKIALQTART
jgi:hypothetical protein